MIGSYGLYAICFAAILASGPFSRIALVNLAVQFLLFLCIASIPAYRFKRMSYVDIAWPFGLMAIGILNAIFANGNPTRVAIISVLYILMGARMGLGALALLRKGVFKREFNRYQYQRLKWQKKGYANEDFVMQKEIFIQGAANCSFLALPAFILGASKDPTLSLMELTAYGLWAFFFLMETLADFQKSRFARSAKDKKDVCDVGLWKYTRHPNYFAEWMVWNSLILASFCSARDLFNSIGGPLNFLLLVATLMVSRIMYICLVHYTGAAPSEYYSQQKRPAYKKYMQKTNKFFPGPPKVSA